MNDFEREALGCLDEIKGELVALREELSYLARDVEWIANGGVGQDVALREQYLKPGRRPQNSTQA